MAILAWPGNISNTAWAMTWDVEWRTRYSWLSQNPPPADPAPPPPQRGAPRRSGGRAEALAVPPRLVRALRPFDFAQGAAHLRQPITGLSRSFDFVRPPPSPGPTPPPR